MFLPNGITFVSVPRETTFLENVTHQHTFIVLVRKRPHFDNTLSCLKIPQQAFQGVNHYYIAQSGHFT